MKENILKLRFMGYTYNQIQKELGCSKGTISYHLGEGQKQKTRQRSQKRREEVRDIIRTFKQNKVCPDCNVSYPYYVMDFDHISDNKIESISKMANWFPIKEIIEEIDKCEVVCANCHRERTHRRKMLL
jgi:predicted transcriptional regulator